MMFSKQKGLIAFATLILTACGGDDSNNAVDNTTQPPAETNPDQRSPSVARDWNEALLKGIRNDNARPTVHARNLFHVSAAMYDAWAVLSADSDAFLLGNARGNFSCPFDGIPAVEDTQAFREEAISFAAFRLILHRFYNSPNTFEIEANARGVLNQLGYDAGETSLDYSTGSAAALGNYIAQCYIDYGRQDGSNEKELYKNQYYTSVNPYLEPEKPGNPDIVDLNHWQALSLVTFIDQSGFPVNSTPEFLSPEWGQVDSFALQDADKTTYIRDGFAYNVYFDPGMPPQYTGDSAQYYKWNFSLVANWSAHLDPTQGPEIDISPAGIGNLNIADFPTDFTTYDTFYDKLGGGENSPGHRVNPVTGQPYAPQIVPLGDYARVLAEFWADGPDSETPPGHWFVILNQVNDHPMLERKIQGKGAEVGPLEWDIKAYFTLGGAMHDSAIAAWGVKGWYDYIRPVSAIRAMADRGQSSNPDLPSYHEDGMPLEPGFVELVVEGDALAGTNNENVGKIKLYSWRGPDYIADPDTDMAGVGWILAENWWPYQRPTFVTPPFAGYVSGHSTFSRAAAEVLTAFTGTPYFPGGVGEFAAPKNEFLVFEEGPSVDVTLQWATYRDASDQCSLSRIWGGIHPPADDLPGRFIGEKIGQNAFSAAMTYFSAQ
ncbi:MAG: vanadium-dependent haloperoxidase [Pseudomonadales bacterium]|nr:vanadium-dependent haloperoxidase [Pseudomonadales bacterium]